MCMTSEDLQQSIKEIIEEIVDMAKWCGLTGFKI